MISSLPQPLADLHARCLQFWRARNGRERLVLSVGGALLALLMLDLAVIEPLVRERARLERSLPALRMDAANFARDIAAIKGQTGGGTADLAQIAGSMGLNAPAVKIDSTPRQARLQAGNVAWVTLTELIAQAQAQGWQLQRLSAKLADDNKVNAELEWTR
ncbi:type II secretion system protein GspM [Chitinimonas sp. BJYL2]|uniref:type II secretion system protein GspM n=1 Tax=Chitinimonas sp. BJYL2 TaxID=2976696 RepID=UPI0022B40EEE|nr:type II secretion system protein GspM [Chitinimonas sp. BJYL2]